MKGDPILGLGRLHHIPTELARCRVLGAAMDAGFMTFDMAPSYGEGLVEATVGRFMRGKVGRPRVYTKFGIPFSPLGELSTPLFFFLRGLKKVTRTAIGTDYAQRDFSVPVLRASVAASLRRLKVSCIDCLFIHEPLTKPTSDQFFETIDGLHRLREEGLIRDYGLTAAGSHARDLLATGGGFPPSMKLMIPATSDLEDSCRAPRVPNEIVAYDIVTHLTRRRGAALSPADVVTYCRTHLPAVVPVVASRRLDRIAAYGRAFAQSVE
jgi:hypothetical protein